MTRYYTNIAKEFVRTVNDNAPEHLTIIRVLGIVPPLGYSVCVEIEDTNAPSECEGKLVTPVFKRDAETGACSVVDYVIETQDPVWERPLP